MSGFLFYGIIKYGKSCVNIREERKIIRSFFRTTSIFGGTISGAVLGSTFGTTLFPGIGTIVGGVIGAIAGSNLSALIAKKISRLLSWFANVTDENCTNPTSPEKWSIPAKANKFKSFILEIYRHKQKMSRLAVLGTDAYEEHQACNAMLHSLKNTQNPYEYVNLTEQPSPDPEKNLELAQQLFPVKPSKKYNQLLDQYLGFFKQEDYLPSGSSTNTPRVPFSPKGTYLSS